MRYLNTFNGHYYYMKDGVVMVSNGECEHKSNFDFEGFNSAIADGVLVPMEVNEDNFETLCHIEKIVNPGYNIRFLAFVVHQCKQAWIGNVIERKHLFVNWIADRKRDYKEAFPQYVISDTITDHDHFTGFILSGAWL